MCMHHAITVWYVGSYLLLSLSLAHLLTHSVAYPLTRCLTKLSSKQSTVFDSFYLSHLFSSCHVITFKKYSSVE